MNVEWIDTDAGLREICDHFRREKFVAMDTEFHRERRFYAKLALVQLASTKRVACVDPLAIDVTALDELMVDPTVTKVLHASRQDLEIFFDRTGHVPAPLFDTQIAASLLGFGEQVSYAALVQRVSGVTLAKTHGLADWLRRPVGADALEYAAADVLHLPEVYRSLDQELRARGRRTWLDEEQEYLSRSETFIVPDSIAWTRVKGAARLRGVECAIAQQLTIWRERRARKLDRPRKHMLADHVIVSLARLRPTSLEQLESVRTLTEGTRRRHGGEILERVESAMRLKPAMWPAPLSRKSSPGADGAVVQALQAIVHHHAHDAEVSARILAPREQLQRVASGETDVPILTGWRSKLVGDRIRAFMDGRLCLHARRGHLQVVERAR